MMQDLNRDKATQKYEVFLAVKYQLRIFSCYQILIQNFQKFILEDKDALKEWVFDTCQKCEQSLFQALTN